MNGPKDGPKGLKPGQEATLWRNFPHYSPSHNWHTDALLVRQGPDGPTEIMKGHPAYYGQLPLLPGMPGA
jgi:hypothetical protein